MPVSMNMRSRNPARAGAVTIRIVAMTLLPLSLARCGGGEGPWAARMADAFMMRNPDSIAYRAEPRSGRWGYEQGVMLEAMRQLWRASGSNKYLAYIRHNIDRYVGEDGAIATYEEESYNLDNIPPGRQLLTLYRTTGDMRYRRAAEHLRRQLANQPRTREGGFWHKKIYPFQMWLDGLYMAEPFYAEYAGEFRDTSAFDDIANQFIFVERHTRDSSSGLLYHAWDENARQRWADPATGHSPQFWGRAMGWYGMALVDVLDSFPSGHPKRPELVAILNRLASAVLGVRDTVSGLWYQVIDQDGREGNYLEASSSCMFVYVFAKGARKGYLPGRFASEARRSFQGVLDRLVTPETDGLPSLHHTCRGAGLGGDPYRDGSYGYYISEPQRSNDFKGVGPFIMAALELEQPPGK
jgi:unsaturated rhamnogalacturonyl hydrolase